MRPWNIRTSCPERKRTRCMKRSSESECRAFRRYVPQVEVQRGLLERITEWLGSKKATCVVPAHSCACAFLKGFKYAEEDDE